MSDFGSQHHREFRSDSRIAGFGTSVNCDVLFFMHRTLYLAILKRDNPYDKVLSTRTRGNIWPGVPGPTIPKWALH